MYDFFKPQVADRNAVRDSAIQEGWSTLYLTSTRRPIPSHQGRFESGRVFSVSGGSSEVREILRGIPTLRRLGLEGVELGRDLLPLVSDLGADLSNLVLKRCAIRDEDLTTVAEAFPSLRTLDLDQNPVGDYGFASLSNLPELVGLSLLNCPVGDSGIEAIVHNAPSLVRLRVGPNPIAGSAPGPGADSAHAVSQHLTNLRELAFVRSPIGDRGANHLAGGSLGKLQTLDLQKCGVTFRGFDELARATWPNLADLNLSFNNLSSSSIFSAERLLSSGIERLRMVGCDIPGEIFGPRATPDLSRLKRINLTDNDIGDTGLHWMLQRPLDSILSLSLIGCGLTDASTDDLVEAMPYSIKTLDLGHNIFSESAKNRISAAFPGPPDNISFR